MIQLVAPYCAMLSKSEFRECFYAGRLHQKSIFIAKLRQAIRSYLSRAQS